MFQHQWLAQVSGWQKWTRFLITATILKFLGYPISEAEWHSYTADDPSWEDDVGLVVEYQSKHGLPPRTSERRRKMVSSTSNPAELKIQLNNQPAFQPAGAKEPRATLPEKFNGTRSQFRGFMNQISLVFQLNPTRYESDATKVATVGTLLHGDALAWFNPLLENQSVHSETLNSWSLFKKSLTDTFGELDLETISASKIRTLLQGTQTASSEYWKR